MTSDVFLLQARAVIVAGEARAKSLEAVAEALGGAQVQPGSITSRKFFHCRPFCDKCSNECVLNVSLNREARLLVSL